MRNLAIRQRPCSCESLGWWSCCIWAGPGHPSPFTSVGGFDELLQTILVSHRVPCWLGQFTVQSPGDLCGANGWGDWRTVPTVLSIDQSLLVQACPGGLFPRSARHQPVEPGKPWLDMPFATTPTTQTFPPGRRGERESDGEASRRGESEPPLLRTPGTRALLHSQGQMNGSGSILRWMDPRMGRALGTRWILISNECSFSAPVLSWGKLGDHLISIFLHHAPSNSRLPSFWPLVCRYESEIGVPICQPGRTLLVRVHCSGASLAEQTNWQHNSPTAQLPVQYNEDATLGSQRGLTRWATRYGPP